MNTHAFAHLLQLTPAQRNILRLLGNNQHAPFRATWLVRRCTTTPTSSRRRTMTAGRSLN
jgi:hypothetical protein